ncbi:MAG: rRNA maturation RNase YbeY [Candidatus Magnetominusculus sp. LBB02]|nr:rRNA maturation RNase YbeY [Candidatus Magnetominusculus sp. LBB02]
MHALNKEHRGMDKTTDVLSFPMYGSMKEFPKEGEFLLGDVVINTDWIYSGINLKDSPAEAAAAVNIHITTLLVHGLLHLIGYDHEIDARHERSMRKKEAQLINAINQTC